MREAVAKLIREAAQQFILPRFRSKDDLSIQEKTPGDIVTIVDLEVEAFLREGLGQLLPLPFVGEESWGEDARELLRKGSCWLVDPLDGTRSFVEGDERFAVIVARIDDGQCEEGWLYFPATDELYYAKRGEGAHSSQGVSRVANPTNTGRYRLNWVASDQRNELQRRLQLAGWSTDTPTCWEFRRILLGEPGGYLCSHVTPWDMVAGVLLVVEAGGTVIRSDRSTPTPSDEQGLYVFAPDDDSAENWIATFELSSIQTSSPIDGV